MVNQQVQRIIDRNKLDPEVMNAMAETPRDKFIPKSQLDYAFDMDVTYYACMEVTGIVKSGTKPKLKEADAHFQAPLIRIIGGRITSGTVIKTPFFVIHG